MPKPVGLNVLLDEIVRRNVSGEAAADPAADRRAWFEAACNAAVAAGARAAAVHADGAFVMFLATGRPLPPSWESAARYALGLGASPGPGVAGDAPGFVAAVQGGDGASGVCVLDAEPRPCGLHPAQVAAIEAIAARLPPRDGTSHGGAWKAGAFRVLVALQARLSAGGPLADRLGDVVDAAISAIPGADGGAFEVRRGDALVHLAARGSMTGLQGSGKPFPGTAAADCWETRRPVRFDHPGGTGPLPGLGCCALAPVERGGEVAGILKLCARDAGALAADCLDVLSAFAGLASGALAEMAAVEAGAAAAASEARYRAVFGTLVDEAIVVSDMRGLVVDWNVGAERILGWPRDAMVGRPVSSFYEPCDVQAGVPASEDAEALAAGRAFAERRHRRRDGSTFHASVGTTPLLAPDGTAEGIVRSLRDHTLRHEAEQALRAEREVLRTITDHAGPGILQMDGRGRITFANPSACRMFGWEAADLVGRNLHDALHHTRPDGSPYPRHACGIADALRHGVTVPDAEDLFFRKDGKPVNVLVTNAPVLVDGVVVSAVVTVADITARKVSEARAAALSGLGDRLRAASGARAMAALAGETAARALGVDRAGYVSHAADGPGEMLGDWAGPGLDSLSGLPACSPGWIPSLPPVAGAGYPDGCASLAVVPVHEEGRVVGCLFAAGAAPRAWAPDETAFLGAVAGRTREALAREEARERQDLLNAEIVHRMKNLLAMVHAIAMQSTRGAVGVADVRESLGRRILALGSAHDILIGGSAVRAPVGAVIRGGVGVHGEGGRFAFEGPHVEIGADAALSLALTVHELATNAAKYGALTVETGHVDVGWSLEPGEEGEDLAITWRESGGPSVRPPDRKGFGSRLIERGLAGRVGASVTLDFDPAGLSCSVRAPLAGFLA